MLLSVHLGDANNTCLIQWVNFGNFIQSLFLCNMDFFFYREYVCVEPAFYQLQPLVRSLVIGVCYPDGMPWLIPTT